MIGTGVIHDNRPKSIERPSPLRVWGSHLALNVEPPPLKTHSFVEKFRSLLGFKGQVWSEARNLRVAREIVYSRAQFEAGEITALRDVFVERTQQYPAVKDESHLGQADVFGLIGSLKGYEGVLQKDYEYMLTETGFSGKAK